MKQIYKIGLTVVTSALIFSACGGGGGGSSTSTGTNDNTSNNTPASTSTDVTVERGAVYNSVVTDANGQIAIQKDGQNVYTFVTNPVYPITAKGGIIDVDGNGIDEGDIELSTPLTSYSNVISPITDYVGDTNSDSGKSKLAKLKEISGVSDDELLKKAPSVVGKSELLALTNAIFSIKNDDDSTNDDFVSSYETSSFKTKFENLKVLASGYADKKEMAKALEEKVVDDLQISKLSLDEAEKNKAESGKAVDKLKFSDIGRMVSYSNNYYSDGDIYSSKIYYYSAYSPDWILEDDTPFWEFKKDETNPYKIYLTNLETNEQWSKTILSTKKIDNLDGASYADLYQTTSQLELIKEKSNLDWYKNSMPNPIVTTNNNEKIAIVDIDSFIKAYTVKAYTPNSSIDELYTPITHYTLNNENVFFNADGTVTNEEPKILSNSLGSYISYARGIKVVGNWKKDGDQLILTIGKEVRYIRIVFTDGNYYIENASLLKAGFGATLEFYTGNDLDLLVSDIKTKPLLFGPKNVKISTFQGVINVYSNAIENKKLPVTYSLSGKDADKFNIDSLTGTITFKDSSIKAEYSIKVIITNSKNQISTRNIDIKIVNTPKFKFDATSTTVNENSTFAYKSIVLNPIDVVFSLDGKDANYFNIDSKTGEITFKTAPDYESGKILYNFYVVATKKSGESSTQSIGIEIRDILESFQSGETFKGLVYNIVTSPITGKKWLDRNLGATKVCENSTDEACFGDYYQWGRLTDGHEKVNSSTTTTKATDIINAGLNFILAEYNDWTTADTNGASRLAQWSKTDGAGICPVGFRVPTFSELSNETINYTGTNNTTTGAVKVINSATAFENFLKFPTAGHREYLDGLIYGKNDWIYLWTNSLESNNSPKSILIDSSGAFTDSFPQSVGHTVRCIKN